MVRTTVTAVTEALHEHRAACPCNYSVMCHQLPGRESGPCVSHTVMDHDKEMEQVVKEATRQWDAGKGTLKQPPLQPSDQILSLGQALC